VCIGGACTAFLPTVAGDLPEGTGLFVQALAAPAGALTLVYYDHSQGDLKLATRQGASFTVTLLDGGSPATDVGQFCTARLAADGTIDVAYVDADQDRLLFTQVAAGAAGPVEVIDDGLRDDGPHPVGGGATLHLDGTTVRVLYQDQQLADLLVATRGQGWTHQALEEGTVGYGWWPHVVLDRAKLYLTEFTYDRARGNQVGALAVVPLVFP
jgi:hypothetical protein